MDTMDAGLLETAFFLSMLIGAKGKQAVVNKAADN